MNKIKLLTSFILCAILSFFFSCSPDDEYSKDNSKSHVCGHKTKDGGYCKRVVSDGHTYCWQHR